MQSAVVVVLVIDSTNQALAVADFAHTAWIPGWQERKEN